MKIERRKLLMLVTGFMIATSSKIVMSLTQKKYSIRDRHRALPFFWGWYDWVENSDVSKKVSVQGINLLMPYVSKSKNYAPKDLEPVKIKSFLDEANKFKVKVLLEIYVPLVESEDISGIKDFIRTYQHHPAVYGWHLYDEPEMKKPNPINPESLVRIYQAIKSEDKTKPVAIVFTDPTKIEPYADAMDILMWDCYPCNNRTPEFQWVSYYRQSLYKVISIANIKNKKFYNVVQAYANNEQLIRLVLPTKAEFQYMFYLSILAGADGILFFVHHFSTPAWNNTIIYPAIKNLKQYLPAIISGKNSSDLLESSSSDVEMKLFSIPKTRKYIMIMLNHCQAKIDLTVNFDRQLAGKRVLTNRSRVTHSSNHGFSVALQPYEALICEFG